MNGLLVIDKPAGMTSREAVDRVKGWFPRGTRLGHTGTLDPLATGVLVVCVGAATRLAEYVQAMAKAYDAGLVLGVKSDTDDAEGILTPTSGSVLPDAASIESCLRGFIGEIEQVPPAYSAAKVTGRRAYALARRGQEPDLAPRRVRIDSIDITAYEPPRLSLRILCGKGTYIRSLARDLGNRLGSGAYVESLRRTRVGIFEADQAASLDATPARARESMRPLAHAVADLAHVALAAEAIDRLGKGQAIPLTLDNEIAQAADVAVFDQSGNLVAIARQEGSVLLPQKVFSSRSDWEGDAGEAPAEP
jgi:tRNA pseudouridine55 synthase